MAEERSRLSKVVRGVVLYGWITGLWALVPLAGIYKYAG